MKSKPFAPDGDRQAGPYQEQAGPHGQHAQVAEAPATAAELGLVEVGIIGDDAHGRSPRLVAEERL